MQETPGKLRVAFIVNPISGTIHLLPIERLIETLIDKSRFDYTLVKTERRGHATELAKGFSTQGFNMVVAVGGDGTVNETACGLLGSGTALGILPFGSGNGLARHIGMPMDPIMAINALNKTKIRRIDYGVMNGHPFFCTCGVGFDAHVSKRFAECGRRGKISYVEKAVTEFFSYANQEYTLNIDGQDINERAFIVTCANAEQWGNNAYIAPYASLSDGFLDIAVVTPIPKLEIPLFVIQLMDKGLERNERIKYHKCKNLTIVRNKPGAAHYDGEPLDLDCKIEISIVEKGLRIAIPRKTRSL